MDTSIFWFLVGASALCGAWRVRSSSTSSDASFASPISVLGIGYLLLVASWGLDGYFSGEPDPSASLVLLATGVAAAITPKSEKGLRVAGCKVTPVTGGLCFLTRVLVAECAQIYTVCAATLYCAAALWNCIPKLEVSLEESSSFLEEHLSVVLWPTFVVTDTALVVITSGGVESKSSTVECDEPLQDGTIQVRTKSTEPDTIVLDIQKLFMSGKLGTGL